MMRNPQPSCDEQPFQKRVFVEDFATLQTGDKGTGFETRQEFGFELYRPAADTSNLSIKQDDMLGNGLFYHCHSTRIQLPVEAHLVTLIFKGFPATINFQAFDEHDNLVDSTVRTNEHNEGATTVELGPTEDRFTHVHMHHVDEDSCEFDCGEPIISEVRAYQVDLFT